MKPGGSEGGENASIYFVRTATTILSEQLKSKTTIASHANLRLYTARLYTENGKAHAK